MAATVWRGPQHSEPRRGAERTPLHRGGSGAARLLRCRSGHRIRVLGAACCLGRNHARPDLGRQPHQPADESMADARREAQTRNHPRQGCRSGERGQEAARRRLAQGRQDPREDHPANRGRPDCRFGDSGIHADGRADDRGGIGAAGSVRQCCQPAAGPRHGAAKGDRYSARDRRRAPATGTPVADRKLSAGVRRGERRISAGCGGGSRHLQLQASAALPHCLRLQCRLARCCVHARLIGNYRSGVWVGSRFACFAP